MASLDIKLSLTKDTVQVFNKLADILIRAIEVGDAAKAVNAEVSMAKVEESEDLPWRGQEEEVPPAEQQYTLDDVRGALQGLAKKKGREYAKSFLSSKFGANKISELPADAYESFITAVGGEPDA